MNARISSDIGAGLLFASTGAVALYVSANYPRGTLARLGPGAFAWGISIGLIAIGVALAIRGFTRDGPLVKIGPLGQPLTVLCATAAFIVALQSLGFLVACFALVGLCWMTQQKRKLAEAIVTYMVLCALVVAVFIYGLGVNIPLWGR